MRQRAGRMHHVLPPPPLPRHPMARAVAGGAQVQRRWGRPELPCPAHSRSLKGWLVDGLPAPLAGLGSGGFGLGLYLSAACQCTRTVSQEQRRNCRTRVVHACCTLRQACPVQRRIAGSPALRARVQAVHRAGAQNVEAFSMHAGSKEWVAHHHLSSRGAWPALLATPALLAALPARIGVDS